MTLPSGPAVRITATVNHGGAPIAIDLYSLLHKGVTYHFTYFTSTSQRASALAEDDFQFVETTYEGLRMTPTLTAIFSARTPSPRER